MKSVTIIAHPLVQHNLAKLRDKNTDSEAFRRGLGEVAALMVYEATRSFQTRTVKISTPVAETVGLQLQHEVILVPILRAGLGMLNPILTLIPHARVGFLGLKRHEKTLQAQVYHRSLPTNLADREIILIDPMLATGGSAVAALKLMKARGANRMRLVNLVASPEGIRRVHAYMPDLPIFTAAIDRKLNSKGYIVPGLGDAGDRLFGV